jgi:hypothetical protein
MCDIAAIDKDLHVVEQVDADGRPLIKITFPNVKTKRGDCVPTFLHDEAYFDVKAWLDRRRTIFPESRLLFVNQRGDEISTPGMDGVLNTLCKHAGYEARFFTLHSGRMGFGSRLAALEFSRGNNVNDVYARAGATGRWTPRSSAIERYCDTRISRFFDTETPMSLAEFRELPPATLHGLSHINPVFRCRPTWFLHGMNLLQQLCNWLEIPTDRFRFQSELRTSIGRKLFWRDREMRHWLRRFYGDTRIHQDSALPLVCYLLEFDLLTVDFHFELLHPSDLSKVNEAMRVHFPDSFPPTSSPTPVSAARGVRVVEVVNSDHLIELQTVMASRSSERHVTVAITDDHTRLQVGSIHNIRRTAHTEESHILNRLRPTDTHAADANADPIREIPEAIPEVVDLIGLSDSESHPQQNLVEIDIIALVDSDGEIPNAIAERVETHRSDELVRFDSVVDIDLTNDQDEDEIQVPSTPQRIPKRVRFQTPSTGTSESWRERGNGILSNSESD